MNVLGAKQTGDMQKRSGHQPLKRQLIFTNIVYWLCSGIKFARFVDQPNSILVHHKDGSAAKLNRRIMLWTCFRFFVKNAIQPTA